MGSPVETAALSSPVVPEVTPEAAVRPPVQEVPPEVAAQQPPAAMAAEGYNYTHTDGTVYRAETTEAAMRACPVLGKMALGDVKLLLEVSAAGQKLINEREAKERQVKASQDNRRQAAAAAKNVAAAKRSARDAAPEPKPTVRGQSHQAEATAPMPIAQRRYLELAAIVSDQEQRAARAEDSRTPKTPASLPVAAAEVAKAGSGRSHKTGSVIAPLVERTEVPLRAVHLKERARPAEWLPDSTVHLVNPLSPEGGIDPAATTAAVEASPLPEHGNLDALAVERPADGLPEPDTTDTIAVIETTTETTVLPESASTEPQCMPEHDEIWNELSLQAAGIDTGALELYADGEVADEPDAARQVPEITFQADDQQPVEALTATDLLAAEPPPGETLALGIVAANANQQPLQQTLEQVARYLSAVPPLEASPLPEHEHPDSPAAELDDVAIEPDATPAQRHRQLHDLLAETAAILPRGYLSNEVAPAESSELNPELHRKLLALLRAVGYEYPQETLMAFERQYGRRVLLQSVRRLHQLSRRENRQEFQMPAARFVPGDDTTRKASGLSAVLGNIALRWVRALRNDSRPYAAPPPV